MVPVMDTSSTTELSHLIETWRQATIDFVDFARTIDASQWETPTALDGWNVKDVAAHCAHLEAVLAGGPEETVDIGSPTHVKNLMGAYTEQGVVARKGRTMPELCDEIEKSSRQTHEALRVEPPTDPDARPTIPTPGGVPWTIGTLLSNRPLDLWMHEQDLRRAVGQPGGFESLAASHTIDVLGAGLGMVVGKRARPPEGTSVQIDVPLAGRSWRLVINDGRAVEDPNTDPATVKITLSPEDFVGLGGGRLLPEQAHPIIEGDQQLGRMIALDLALTP